MSNLHDAEYIVGSEDSRIAAGVRAHWPDEVSQLHMRGPLPGSRPAIAIIGTTDPDPLARAWAFTTAQLAARSGWDVVSGLTRGIDMAAHEGALSAGGVTIGVVAHGLDLFEPSGRAVLAERMLGLGGSLISIVPAGTPVSAERLLLRNQFTSGFADIVLTVQSRGRGGTLATMRHACRQRKLLASFAPPAHAEPDAWSGNTLLLAEASPWRDRNLHWQPAVRLEAPQDLAQLFAHFSNRPAVDDPHPVRETRKPEQPRLLEERATYNGDL
jgi:predicted Rossmann fold nucleotide-binding protein DprA/Smf involved in DNA uptake